MRIFFLLTVILLSGAPVHAEIHPLIKGIIFDDPAAVSAWLQTGSADVSDQRGNPALVLAASYKRAKIVGLLLNAGADVSAANPAGMTALMTAAGKGHQGMIKRLLAAGANVNRQNPKSGWTALMLAAQNNHVKPVGLLLKNGADTGLRNRQGKDVLQIATGSVRALLETAKPSSDVGSAMLLPAGANGEPQSSSHADERFPAIWKETYPNLEETLELKEKHETLPDSAWFGRDKKSNQEDINELLQEAIKLLGISDIREIMQELNETDEKIKKLRTRVGEYRTSKIGEPGKADEYDKKITALTEEIARYQKEIKDKKTAIATQLRNMGINISNEQLEVLLAGVNGNDMVQMSVVFNNVKILSNQLAQLMTDNQEDLDFAKKHYGMYTILIEILISMQQNFLDDVQHKYIPGIEQIVERAGQLTAETRQILSVEPNSYRRAALQSSLESQRFTLKTAALYKKLLNQQAKQVRKARDALERDFSVALIRYKTVKISGDLVNMIRAGNNQFHTLANLQLPEIMPFENLQMKSEFEKLTAELRRTELD
ncbi:MAG: hypothetical protein GY862_34400 [Gammaproteobacteria bacterium]|nr:hypothetical protein [Gammaproteobacteria bacterium]